MKLEQMSYEQLLASVKAQNQTIDQQKAIIEKARIKNSYLEKELQGAKVMISILVQREGGEVKIPDTTLKEHTFDLIMRYDPAQSSTIFKSRVTHVPQTEKEVPLKETEEKPIILHS